MTARKRVILIKTALYNRPPGEKDPQPRQPYLKASKIGVNGFSSRMFRNLSEATLSG
jgi:hypothetical protein